MTELPCPECDGGMAWNPKGEPIRCPNCGGYGLVLTELGESIVNLIRRRTHTQVFDENQNWRNPND